VGVHPGGGRKLLAEIAMTQNGPELAAFRDGAEVPVRYAIAVAGSEIELTIDRFDWLAPDDPIVARAARVHAQAFETAGGHTGTDHTRPIVVTF